MDKVYTRSEIARMLNVDRETIIRLQAGGTLDRVDTSKIEGGVSESSIKAYLAGTVATMDRTLRLGRGR
jgi:hypothetical protein